MAKQNKGSKAKPLPSIEEISGKLQKEVTRNHLHLKPADINEKVKVLNESEWNNKFNSMYHYLNTALISLQEARKLKKEISDKCQSMGIRLKRPEELKAMNSAISFIKPVVDKSLTLIREDFDGQYDYHNKIMASVMELMTHFTEPDQFLMAESSIKILAKKTY